MQNDPRLRLEKPGFYSQCNNHGSCTAYIRGAIYKAGLFFWSPRALLQPHFSPHNHCTKQIATEVAAKIAGKLTLNHQTTVHHRKLEAWSFALQCLGHPPYYDRFPKERQGARGQVHLAHKPERTRRERSVARFQQGSRFGRVSQLRTASFWVSFPGCQVPFT